MWLIAGGLFLLLSAYAVWLHLEVRDLASAVKGIEAKEHAHAARGAQLLAESIERQTQHEIEYPHHGGLTISLRVEAIVRRWEKKLKAEGIPVEDRRILRQRVKEALCLPRG